MELARASRRALSLGLLLAVACESAIDPPDLDDGGPRTLDPNDAGSDPGDPVFATAGMPLRRLTPLEYVNTVRAVSGVDVSDLLDRIPRDGVLDGFDNNHRIQSLGVAHAAAYQEIAEVAAARLLAGDALRTSVVGCDVAGVDGAACLQGFAPRLLRRAYRRTPTEAEVARVLAVAADVAGASPDPWSQVAGMVELVLQDADLLFRPEIGETDDPPQSKRLTGFEMATRLSYGLLQTAPDDDLLDAAAAGELGSAQGVEVHARRLLDDPRNRDALQVFARQWLATGLLDTASFDVARFPQYTDELRRAAQREVDHLIDQYLAGDQDALGIYTADTAWVSDELAALYELEAPGASVDNLVPVDVAGHPTRGGLFTTAGFLMATSKSFATSIVHRGLYVRTHSLCETPPPPPPDVPMITDDDENASASLSTHLASPECAGCHEMMDPIGMGLEGYNAIGA